MRQYSFVHPLCTRAELFHTRFVCMCVLRGLDRSLLDARVIEIRRTAAPQPPPRHFAPAAPALAIQVHAGAPECAKIFQNFGGAQALISMARGWA